ncbi:16S rRNA (guanine1516-N2)-methyltransferase [Mesocricetibacter intestinalis]|uniref:Ribosomal RNA small subunit methyltransferase J n=1 Tax=Mesocricetibacter intestinalis TaxID=1521930 RepID=A0A4V3D9L9_9PAST|nr:class I SAM-dependent methyltransferase [Mesocricetibacter intestinalis]TDQ57721.1 16S rRNA (guanine1516-N2)-methyltransferase [Mesocricetibacter intestinalis]
MNIRLICETGNAGEFTALCQTKGLQDCAEGEIALVQIVCAQGTRLELRKLNEPKLGAVYVDFSSGVMAHRRKFGGGRAEAVAKAVGIKGEYLPDIIDATAGLGRDAFVLASLGCRVRLLERHPAVYLLLQDGLRRAYADPHIGAMLSNNLQLLNESHIRNLDPQQISADVVYLDPMYPHKQKSALVKKEMRLFQQLVGADADADELLAPALALAKKRVVVKRPAYADFLAGKKPDFSRETKNHRFDIYLTFNGG